MVARSYYLSTFAIGLTLLILGVDYYKAPDWDIPISIIMATLAFLTAPYSMRVVLGKKWNLLPVMILLTWFTVDGSYCIYWSIVDPSALVMRPYNFGASLALYGICGLLWINKRGIIV